MSCCPTWLGDLNVLNTNNMYPCGKNLLCSSRKDLGSLACLLLAMCQGTWKRPVTECCDYPSMPKEGECSEMQALPLGDTALLVLIWPWSLLNGFDQWFLALWEPLNRFCLYSWRLQHYQFHAVWSPSWENCGKLLCRYRWGMLEASYFLDVSQTVEQGSLFYVPRLIQALFSVRNSYNQLYCGKKKSTESNIYTVHDLILVCTLSLGMKQLEQSCPPQRGLWAARSSLGAPM